MSVRHKVLSREQHQQVLQKLRLSDNLLSTILQGHLYVEYWLNEVILKEWGSGRIIIDKFSFSQKVHIVEAAGLADMQEIVQSFREINALRNCFAHALFPEDIEAKLDKLTIPFEQYEDPTTLSTGVGSFLNVITRVSVFLLGYCEGSDGTAEPDSLLPVFLDP